MNAGLSTLIWLKRRLLMASDVVTATYDEAIAALGLGVAGHFEDLTGRKFSRVAGAIHEFDASRTFTLVARYPIESFASIELRETYAGGWQAWLGDYNVNSPAGMVTFPAPLGAYGVRGRLTYTGGWWWNTNESAEDTMPTGATAVPPGLQLAWAQACKFLWDRGSIEDRSKAGFSDTEIERFVTGESQWPPFVVAAINQHRSAA
jgi:hypothetical protein